MNPNFVAPPFPDRTSYTVTSSTSSWAIMVEQGAQAVEALLGPLLEAIACEAEATSAFEAELRRAALPCPPFSAAACCRLIQQYPVMKERLPLTIRRRTEAATEALQALQSARDSLTGAQALAGQTAFRHVLQDCVKACGLPSLLGQGSGGFAAFIKQMLPHLQSQVIYLDTLVLDCQEAMKTAAEIEAA